MADAETCTLVLVGDTAFAGPLAQDPLAHARGMDPDLRDLLRGDLVVGNLESVLCDTISSARQGYGLCPLLAPTGAAEALRFLGFGAVGLANNHNLDYGPEALESTLLALDSAGIGRFGAGRNAEEAARPLIVTRGPSRIGFVGFGGVQYPTRNRAGSFPLDSSNTPRIVRQARTQCDFLVAFFHEGIEATHFPMASTIRGCHKVVDAGADLVVGTHPHTIQGIEQYEGVPILYSLGNFVLPMLEREFYERWLAQTDLTRMGISFDKAVLTYGIVVRCDIGDRKVRDLQTVPILTDESGLPRLAQSAEAEEVRRVLRDASAAFEHPADPLWDRQRDIERRYRALGRSELSWRFVLRNLHKLRWRHVRAGLKGMAARWPGPRGAIRRFRREGLRGPRRLASDLAEKSGIALDMGWSVLRSWRTREKILVIESDDWGSIRTSSREAYERLRQLGYPMDRSPFSLDAIESDRDLEMLFETLESVRDSRHQPACVTANMIMGNPDFERIRQSGFRQYHYEPNTVTLSRLEGRARVEDLWKQGLARELFLPQFHARGHVRFWEWLDALRDGSQEALETFRLEMCGVPLAASREGRGFYAARYVDSGELSARGIDLDHIITDGLRMFHETFGYRSLSTIAPNYCWTDDVERIWVREGIRYVQGGLYQVYPRPGGKTRRRPHFLGQRSPAGCLYLVRNCDFEPSENPDKAVARCLRRVAFAFRLGQPAVIDTHRMNYIGSIRPENRERGLAKLRELLQAIVRQWPSVVFLNSVQLGRMIEHGRKSADQVMEVTVT